METALTCATRCGSYQVIRLLVNAGACIEAEDNKGHDLSYLVEHGSFYPATKATLLLALHPLHIPGNPVAFCDICKKLDGGKFVLFEPCGHYFHTQCAQNYLDISNQCPTCLANVIFAEQKFKVQAPHDDGKEAE